MSKVKTMSIGFKSDMFEKINLYCAERGCTRSWFVNKAVQQYLQECLEDMQDYEIAASAWKEFEESGRSKISANELFSKADL